MKRTIAMTILGLLLGASCSARIPEKSKKNNGAANASRRRATTAQADGHRGRPRDVKIIRHYAASTLSAARPAEKEEADRAAAAGCKKKMKGSRIAGAGLLAAADGLPARRSMRMP